MNGLPASAEAVWSLLATHHSARGFRDDPVEDALLERILECGLRAPNWNNGQHVTAVVLRDPQRRRQVNELSGRQKTIEQAPVFVVLVMDFHRTGLAAQLHGREQHVHDNANALLIGAVDAGIVLASLMAAARAAGLATCPIGGVRRHPAQLCRLLELPPLTYPMAGVCIGWPLEAPHALKPRIGLDAFAHPERYDSARSQAALAPLDAGYARYHAAAGRTGAPSWSDWISQRYAAADYHDVGPSLRLQGFALA